MRKLLPLVLALAAFVGCHVPASTVKTDADTGLTVAEQVCTDAIAFGARDAAIACAGINLTKDIVDAILTKHSLAGPMCRPLAPSSDAGAPDAGH